LELVQDWNTEINPLLVNSTTTFRGKGGIYAELKDYLWLLADVGTDLVDLFFQHIDDNQKLWQNAIMQSLCSTKQLKIHDYSLPPLIIQSFEPEALKSFKDQWETRFITNSTNTDKPVPPTILLVSLDKCLDDNFWFQVGDDWRDFLDGIGPDKACLYTAQSRFFMERAEKLDLAVHPWTERPELEYLGGISTPKFETVLDEILYLFCTVGVQGIFSESVEAAVLAANMACPDKKHSDPPLEDGQDSRNKGNSVCYQTGSEAVIYVGLASFAVGVAVSVFAWICTNGRQQWRGRRQIQVPTADTSDGDMDPTGGNMDPTGGDMEIL
jgi:hypothetical protein